MTFDSYVDHRQTATSRMGLGKVILALIGLAVVGVVGLVVVAAMMPKTDTRPKTDVAPTVPPEKMMPVTPPVTPPATPSAKATTKPLPAGLERERANHIRLLKSPAANVRHSSARVLGQMGEHGRPALEPLSEVAKSDAVERISRGDPCEWTPPDKK